MILDSIKEKVLSSVIEIVGEFVGRIDGDKDGIPDGRSEGAYDGAFDGNSVGVDVGTEPAQKSQVFLHPLFTQLLGQYLLILTSFSASQIQPRSFPLFAVNLKDGPESLQQ